MLPTGGARRGKAEGMPTEEEDRKTSEEQGRRAEEIRKRLG